MLRAVAALVLATVTLPALPVRAQDTQRRGGTEDEGHPYVAPSAAKSVEVANFYLKRKKYPAALSRFQEAVQTDPYYADGYLGLGKVYERMGLKQKALEAYRKYLDLLPSAKQAEEARSVHQAIANLEKEGRSSLSEATSKQ